MTHEQKFAKKAVKRLTADLDDLDRIYEDMLSKGMRLDVDSAIKFFEKRKNLRDKLELAKENLKDLYEKKQHN